MKETVYEAYIRTGNKTEEDIKKSGVKEQEGIKAHLGFYHAAEGAHMFLAQINSDDRYVVIAYKKKEDEEKYKNAMYSLEQDPMVGTYRNDREAFDRDWASESYSPCGAVMFSSDEIEIVEKKFERII